MGVRDRRLLPILVADQHRIIRAGIKVMLSETGSWQQFKVDEAETTEEAIAMVTEREYPVILMEYDLPGRGGIKATTMIMSHKPATCVIALMDTDDRASADRIIKAGAKGCILRNVGLDTLLIAIRTVMAGRQFYSNEIALQLLGQNRDIKPDPLGHLTAREKQVFIAILTGLGDREIGAQLGIAKRTIDKHRQHIHYKLGTRTPLELIQAGLRFGLITLPE